MNSEPLEHVIAKRDSFRFLWALLNPGSEFANLYEICMKRWNSYTYRHQQRIFWFLREKIRKGETIYKNPLYAITYCYPKPYDWNGKNGIEERFHKEKMVSACYNGNFGTYTKNVADYFEMTNITPLN